MYIMYDIPDEEVLSVTVRREDGEVVLRFQSYVGNLTDALYKALEEWEAQLRGRIL